MTSIKSQAFFLYEDPILKERSRQWRVKTNDRLSWMLTNQFFMFLPLYWTVGAKENESYMAVIKEAT